MVKNSAKVKKLIILGIMSTFLVVFCGCTTLSEKATDGVETAFTARIAANNDMINNLEKAGFLDTESASLIRKDLTSIAEKMKNNINMASSGTNSDSTDATTSEVSSAAKYSGELIGGAIIHYVDETDSDNYLIPNLKNNNYLALENKDKIYPIQLINEDNCKTLKERLSLPIYVLDTNSSIDEIKARLDQYVEGSSVKADKIGSFNAMAKKHFKKLTDKDGNPITLIDTDEFPIVSKTTSGANNIDADGVTIKSRKADTNLSGYLSGYPDKPGTDLLIRQHGKDAMLVRLEELNYKAYEKVMGEYNNNGDSGNDLYIVTGDGIFVMQYPVGYIEGFKMGENKDNVSPTIKKSDLEINILTGDIFKVDNSDQTEFSAIGLSTGKKEKVSNLDQYNKVTGGTKDTSSFVVYGNTSGKKNGKPYHLMFGTNKNKDTGAVGKVVKVPMIVLRDYLEATYFPDVIDSEQLVVFGRRLRITALDAEHPIDKPVGYYCDIGDTVETKKVLNPSNDDERRDLLYISDIADINSLLDAEPVVKTIPSILGQKATDNRDKKDTSTDDKKDDTDKNENKTSDDKKDTEQNNSNSSEISGENNSGTSGNQENDTSNIGEYTSRVESLKKENVMEVHTTVAFPSSTIGVIDSSKVFTTDPGIELFYAMAVTKPMSETGLLLWLTSSDDTNSIVWWNNWLIDHGFEYKIDIDRLNGGLKENYSFELSQNGYFILNIETISKIQAEYDEQDTANKIGFMRTTFKILGYFLIMYAFVLMMAWVTDVNVDLGFQVLNKASFNNLTAVSDTSGVGDVKGTKYVDFRGITAVALKIMIIGLLLVFVDIITLVMVLINTFSKLIGFVFELIGGTN